MVRSFLIIFSLILLISCKPEETKLTAQQIIDKSIEVSGVQKVSNATISFDFRNRNYRALRYNGKFALERITKTDSSDVKDVLFNDGFQRYINNLPYAVVDSMALKYSESVNSVHYFSVLPYGLNDGAVQKKLLEGVEIKGKEYYKVEITFQQEGGGVDFEDVFVYWISKESFQIDYLSYLFHVNGGGKRFRSVNKEQTVEGIRFANYDNHKPNNPNIDVRAMDVAYEKGELTKVSEINLENIQVQFDN